MRGGVEGGGLCVNEKSVEGVMKELGVVCGVGMKKYGWYKGEVGKIGGNVVNGDLEGEKGNEKWVRDVRELRVLGEKVYV